MKTTQAIPGKPMVMKLRDDEEKIVCDWFNLQNVYSDSIRYLIQKEIAENGLRNLQEFIPQFRSVESLKTLLGYTVSEPVKMVAQPPVIHEAVHDEPVISPLHSSLVSETSSPIQQDLSVPSGYSTNTQENANTSLGGAPKKDTTPVPSGSDMPNQQATVTAPSDSGRKPAKKVFGDDVTKSYAN